MENFGLVIDVIDFVHKVVHLRYQLRKNLKETPLEGEALHFSYRYNNP